MATFEKQKNGRWKAKIRRTGWPAQSKVFDTKTDAEAYARATEREMDRGAFINRDDAERTTFGQAAARYEREVLPTKRGAVQDGARLAHLVAKFGKYSLASITAAKLSEHRDERLKAVSAQTVVHELGLLSRVFKACAMDWNIALPQGVPTALIRKPQVARGRERRLEDGEEALLRAALAECKTPWPLAAFVLALETAARQSEILSLKWKEVDLIKQTARLRGIGGGITKSGADYRDVPLSKAAVAFLSTLPRSVEGSVVPLTKNALQLSHERARERGRRMHLHGLLKTKLQDVGLDDEASKKEISALVYKKSLPLPLTVDLMKLLDSSQKILLDLTFHDIRHEATSRLAEKLQMHELMKVTGHSSSRMLSRYYHPRAEALALKIG
jgi:integrase